MFYQSHVCGFRWISKQKYEGLLKNIHLSTYSMYLVMLKKYSTKEGFSDWVLVRRLGWLALFNKLMAYTLSHTHLLGARLDFWNINKFLNWFIFGFALNFSYKHSSLFYPQYQALTIELSSNPWYSIRIPIPFGIYFCAYLS